jgi:heat shock protein HslJ
MKAMMGFAFFLLFLAGIAFVMLQGREMSQLGGSGAELTDIKWQPTMIGDETIPEDSGMYIRFEVDGSIKGHGGCNAFFGSLERTEAGIGVGPLGGTRMACPEAVMDREMAFMDAVGKTTDFQSSKERMSLLDEDDVVLARFVAKADE